MMPHMQPVEPGPARARRLPDRAHPVPATALAQGVGHAAEVTPAVPRRGRGRALIALARPRQWVKNALVVGAPGAAGALGYDDVPARVLVSCASFCLLSAG